MAQGMTPSNIAVDVRHPNPSINIAEMYGGIEDSFVQVGFEHEHDNDDIVPELTENVVIEKKEKKVDTRKTDFSGEKYEEYYDEWTSMAQKLPRIHLQYLAIHSRVITQ